MCPKSCYFQFTLLFLTISNFIAADPVSSPEISTKPGTPINNFPIHQQHQKLNDIQHAQLNALNVYASNYDAIAGRQNQNDKFKASYKMPEMETNFMPIRNGNSIAPEYTSHTSLGAQAPVLMQYLPQTINEGGVQYLQLIPTRPLMMPIGSYLPGNTGMQTLAYHQHLAPSNSIEYATRPLLTPLPMNIPPPAASPVVDVPSSPVPQYGIQPYAGNLSPYKQNHRINRETKDKQLLGPLNLNLNEYLPQGQQKNQQHATYNIQGRP